MSSTGPLPVVRPSLAARLRARWLSDKGLTRRAYLNTLTEALDYGARLLVGFIINPILLVGLGPYAFGVWQILDRLIGHLNTAGNRPFQALKWTLAQQNLSADYARKRRQVGSAAVTWLLVAPPLALAAGGLAWYAPAWLDVPDEYFGSVRVAALLLAANLLLISLADLPRSVLIGQNLSYKRMGLSALLVLVGGVLTWLAVVFDTGLVGVAAAVLAVSLLTGLLFSWVSLRYVDWLGIARPSLKESRGFLKLSGWFFCWSLVMVVMRGSDVLILGALDSVESVTRYALTRYVPETVISLVAMIAFGVTPGLGGIVGAGDLRRAAALRREIMAFTWLMMAAIATTIVLWNRAFLQLWVGAEHYAGGVESLLIVVVVVQFVFIRNDAFLIELTLKMRAKVLLGAVAAALSAGLCVVLVGPLDMGINGVCLGVIAGRLLLSVGYPWLISGYFAIDTKIPFAVSVRPAAVLTLMLALAFWLEPAVAAPTWLQLIASVAATVLAAAALAFITGLSATQRRLLIERLRAVIGKRRR